MDLYFAPLLGSSAGVYALMCALLPKAGKSRIKLANFDVPLYSIILTILVLSLFKFGDNQSGGAVIAHLGGGLFGYLWIIIGRTTHVDILYPMTLIVNSFVEIFKNEPSPRKKESPLKDKQLDDILHKLRQSGYDALTDEEKRILFEQSKS